MADYFFKGHCKITVDVSKIHGRDINDINEHMVIEPDHRIEKIISDKNVMEVKKNIMRVVGLHDNHLIVEHEFDVIRSELGPILEVWYIKDVIENGAKYSGEIYHKVTDVECTIDDIDRE